MSQSQLVDVFNEEVGMAELSDRAKQLIEREDAKLNQKAGYAQNAIAGNVNTLLQFGRVEVGRRATCGKPDPTQAIYAAWTKVVKRLIGDGIAIEEIPVKHANGWATKAGGFWDSKIFQIKPYN